MLMRTEEDYQKGPEHNAYGNENPFLVSNSNGFLYEYENVIFYRMSGGDYFGYQILDQQQLGKARRRGCAVLDDPDRRTSAHRRDYPIVDQRSK